MNIVEIFQIIIFLQMDKGLIPERAPPGAVLLPDTVRIRNRIQRQHCVPGGIVRLLCSRGDIEGEGVFRLPGESEPCCMGIDNFRRALTGGRQCCFAAPQILCYQDPVVMGMGFHGVYPLVMGMKDLLIVVDEMRTGPFVHEDIKLHRLIATDCKFHCQHAGILRGVYLPCGGGKGRFRAAGDLCRSQHKPLLKLFQIHPIEDGHGGADAQMPAGNRDCLVLLRFPCPGRHGAIRGIIQCVRVIDGHFQPVCGLVQQPAGIPCADGQPVVRSQGRTAVNNVMALKVGQAVGHSAVFIIMNCLIHGLPLRNHPLMPPTFVPCSSCF